MWEDLTVLLDRSVLHHTCAVNGANEVMDLVAPSWILVNCVTTNTLLY